MKITKCHNCIYYERPSKRAIYKCMNCFDVHNYSSKKKRFFICLSIPYGIIIIMFIYIWRVWG